MRSIDVYKIRARRKRGSGVVQGDPGGPYLCEVWNYVIIYVRHSKPLLYNVLIYSPLQRWLIILKRERE